VLVVGGSGSGKSNAVRAGLLPQLRGDDGWTVTKVHDDRRDEEQHEADGSGGSDRRRRRISSS